MLLMLVLLAPSVFGWQQAVAPVPAATLSAAGRGTMQPGGDRAANYITERFAKIGLKPLGDKGSYLQSIKFKELELLPGTALKLGDEPLRLGADFAVVPPYSGDKSTGGELVFIAYGLVASSLKRNDLAGVDVKGKVVLILQGPPKSVDEAAWKKAEAQMIILRNLIMQGAAGIIFVNNGREEHPYYE